MEVNCIREDFRSRGEITGPWSKKADKAVFRLRFILVCNPLTGCNLQTMSQAVLYPQRLRSFKNVLFEIHFVGGRQGNDVLVCIDRGLWKIEVKRISWMNNKSQRSMRRRSTIPPQALAVRNNFVGTLFCVFVFLVPPNIIVFWSTVNLSNRHRELCQNLPKFELKTTWTLFRLARIESNDGEP